MLVPICHMMIAITVLEKVLGGMSDCQCNLMVVKMILSWHPTEPMENGPFRRLHATAQMIVFRLLVASGRLQLMGTIIGAEHPQRILCVPAHL
jgi:hypothetical protein